MFIHINNVNDVYLTIHIFTWYDYSTNSYQHNTKDKIQLDHIIDDPIIYKLCKLIKTTLSQKVVHSNHLMIITDIVIQ